MKNIDSTPLFETLRNAGVQITPEQQSRISAKILSVINYEPRIGFFGKTGAGKSSLCNALFGQEIFEVNDIAACTRAPQEMLMRISGKGIKLIDVPGAGENQQRDREYAALYKSLLPELDAILWVLKGDDRAFTSDLTFYQNLVKPHLEQGKPVFFILNQVDKIEPFRQWNIEKRIPGADQKTNIHNKIRYVAECFNVPQSKVIPVSAAESFNLAALVDEVVYALPADKKITFAAAVEKEHVSKKSIETASNGFIDTIIDVVMTIVPLPPVLKAPIKAGLKWVSNWKIWPWNW